MDKIVVEGGKKLKGEVRVSGAKNATLPIMAAALLTDEPSRIENVPDVQDVATMLKILSFLGAKVDYSDHVLEIKPGRKLNAFAPYHLVSTMRASFCVLG